MRAREIASLKATNIQHCTVNLHNRLGQVLEQSNGSYGTATGHLIATQTATDLIVENQTLRIRVAALEQTVANQTIKLMT